MKAIPRVAQAIPSPQSLGSLPLSLVDVSWTDQCPPALDRIGSAQRERDERSRSRVLNLQQSIQMSGGAASAGSENVAHKARKVETP